MFLESIKHKPYAARVRATWIILGISLLVLIFLWVITSRIGKEPVSGIFESAGSKFKSSQEYWKSIAPEALKK